MDNYLYDIFNNVDEGIVIINGDRKITFCNEYMHSIINKGLNIINNDLYEILPSFKKNYFNESLKKVIKNGYKMFFSASMHSDLIGGNKKFNLKLKKIEVNGSIGAILEFKDVTSEYVRINKLKKHIQELSSANEILKKKEKTIKTLAYYDTLTGIPNRNLFYKKANRLLIDAKKNKSLLGLVFIDVDRFKAVNDTYGHIVGDKVIAQVAKILSKSIREIDFVARYGGDEFLLLLPYLKECSEYEFVTSNINDFKNKYVSYKDKKINISLSMGASFYPRDGKNIHELMIKADKLMYAAKNKYKDNDCLCNMGEM